MFVSFYIKTLRIYKVIINGLGGDMSKQVLHWLFGFTFVVMSSFTQAEVISVVVNSESKLTAASVKKKDIRSLFLGKASNINGVSLSPVAQSRNRSITLIFNNDVLGKSSDKMRAYWSRVMFSGKASPPPELEDDQAVKMHVARNKDAISYMKKSMVDDTVKSIFDLSVTE